MKKIMFFLIMSAGILLSAGDLLQQVKLCRGAEIIHENGTRILRLTVPGPKLRSIECTLPIDTKKYAGKWLEFSAMYRIRDVHKGIQPYFGPKFMVSYMLGGSRSYHGRVPVNEGTCEWTPVNAAMNVANGVSDGRLTMGFQEGYGIVEYKDLQLKVHDNYKLAVPEGFRCEYSERVKKLPFFRGVMSPSFTGMKAKDVRDLGEWNANIIRWQFNIGGATDYDIQFKKNIAYLDALLPEFKKAGIFVIWDMHTVPGGRYGKPMMPSIAGAPSKNEAGADSFRLYYEKPYVDRFIQAWKTIAEHYKNEPTVIAYDLMNEPTTPQKRPTFDYLELQYMAAKEIRKIDPEKIIIVTSINWAAPGAFRQLVPLPLKNIWYTAHMYVPMDFTHQGVGASMKNVKAGKFISYPNKEITAKSLKKTLQPVRDFQLKYGAQILIGEFSAIRWAPGADIYLKDCIGIFEEYQWHWIYHAYREWNGWSVEHGEDPNNQKPVPNTKRKKVLLEGLSRNKK